MGGVNSYCVPRYQNPNRCRENHTSTPKFKGHKRNLSAAFNLADMDTDPVFMDQLNINTATEEELMTLPGINRTTAHNIVDYRRQLGGFKKVEDIALVSGVGATKLHQIRAEICVRYKKGSEGSSRSSSARDLSIQDNVSKSSARSGLGKSFMGTNPPPKINLNSSNVFQLMKVKGISQQLAENIVAYRDRKGRYRGIDDLIKVKGVSHGLVSAVRHQLTLSDEVPPNDHQYLNSSHPPLSNRISTDSSVSNHLPITFTAGNVTCPPVMGLGDSREDLLSMYGPLLQRSFRTQVAPPMLQRNQRRVLRIGTWNLQVCSAHKVENPGVREVVALTILENGLGIIALQELADDKALDKLCEELNSPTIPNVKKWEGQRGTWRAVVSGASTQNSWGVEHLGFLYDASQGIELIQAKLLDASPDVQNTQSAACLPKPFMAHFKVKDWEFKVFNVHLPMPGTETPSVGHQSNHSAMEVTSTEQTQNSSTLVQDHIHSLSCTVQEHSLEGGSTIILGDLGPAFHGECSELFEGRGYHVVLSDDKMAASKEYDNIWMGGQVLAQYTGVNLVVEDGLRSPWIPNGWQWGGRVSEHNPVWAEFFTRQSQTDLASLQTQWLGAGDS